jgi:hypothetical protein
VAKKLLPIKLKFYPLQALVLAKAINESRAKEYEVLRCETLLQVVEEVDELNEYATILLVLKKGGIIVNIVITPFGKPRLLKNF